MPISDFGPSASPTTQLNVVAPLDVNAAPTQASALARAVGVAWDSAQPALKKDQLMAGKQDAQAGQADATLGNIDQDKYNRIEGYRIGAKRITVENHTLQAVQEATTKANTDWANLPVFDTTDASGNIVPGLASNLQSLFTQRLGGLEKDSEAAHVMQPMIMHTMNTLTGQRVQQHTEHLIQQGIDNATSLAVRQATRGDGSFNWSDQLTALTGVYSGDRHAASGALMHAVAQATIQAQDPGLPDKLGIPDKVTFTGKDGVQQTIDGPMYVPGNAQILEEAKAKALELQTKTNHVQVMSVENQIAAGVIQDKDPSQALLQYAKMPGANPAFLVSMSNFYKEKDKANVDDQLNGSAFYGVLADVARGNLTTAPQIDAAISSSGLSGKARVQAFGKGMEALRTTQSTNQDDPAVQGGVKYLDEQYKPGTDPLTGKFNNPAAVSQHSGIMLDFRTEVQKKIGQGIAAEDAANQTIQDVKKKWGDPVELSKSATHGQPTTDVDRASQIMSAMKTPASLAHMGLTSPELQRLRDIGYLSSADVDQVARTLLAQRQPH